MLKTSRKSLLILAAASLCFCSRGNTDSRSANGNAPTAPTASTVLGGDPNTGSDGPSSTTAPLDEALPGPFEVVQAPGVNQLYATNRPAESLAAVLAALGDQKFRSIRLAVTDEMLDDPTHRDNLRTILTSAHDGARVDMRVTLALQIQADHSPRDVFEAIEWERYLAVKPTKAAGYTFFDFRADADENRSFVQNLYFYVLDRERVTCQGAGPDCRLVGAEGWVAQLPTRSKWQVFQAFLASAEYAHPESWDANPWTEPDGTAKTATEVTYTDDACTKVRTRDPESVAAYRAFVVHFGAESNWTQARGVTSACFGVRYWANLMKRDVRLAHWESELKTLKCMIPAGLSVSLDLFNENDAFSAEEKWVRAPAAAGTDDSIRTCPVPSPMLTSTSDDDAALISYGKFFSERAAMARRIFAETGNPIAITANSASTALKAPEWFAGCPDWEGVAAETFTQVGERSRRYFAALGSVLDYKSLNSYPSNAAEDAALVDLVRTIAAGDAGAKPVEITETGFNKAGCYDSIDPAAIAACDATQASRQEAISAALGPLPELTAVHVFAGREVLPRTSGSKPPRDDPNGYAIALSDGTPLPAYNKVPEARRLPVAKRPAWCKHPTRVGEVSVCDFKEELRYLGGDASSCN